MASGSRKRSVRSTDPDFEQTVMEWFNEDESDVSSSEHDSEDDEYLIPEVQVPSPREVNFLDTETSSSDSEGEISELNLLPSNEDIQHETVMIGKNGFKWKSIAPIQTKTLCHNIVRFSSGPRQRNRVFSINDSWNAFVTENMVQEIVICTNREARRQCTAKNKTWNDTDKMELNAFFGLLMLAGVEKQWDTPIRELFLDKCSNPMYKATMTVNRFENLRRFIRFDDKRTRSARLETDKLAPVRYIWELFLAQCRISLIPKVNVTIDEQLLGFRGRCGFIQYMPSKPAKYGIKFFWMCESETGYAIDGLIYIGKQPGEEIQRNLGKNIVSTLTNSIKNTSRNLTCDNFFTSVELFQDLLKIGLTAVGTIRQNKREVPLQFKASKDRSVYSTMFGFNENLTLVSYVPKKNKAVTLLSTMHHDGVINENSAKKKPEIIEFYNKTKGGVDHMDQMVGNYTCKRQTRRWPFAVFSNILDIAALNAFFLYIEEHPQFENGKSHRRRLFLKQLCKELVTPHMEKRSQNPYLRRDTLEYMKIFIQITPEVETNEPPAKKRRCYVCPSKLGRMSTMICSQCKKNICKEHSLMTCVNCK